MALTCTPLAGLERNLAKGRPHVYDMPISLFNHHGRNRLAQKKNGFKAAVYGPVPFLFGDIQGIGCDGPGSVIDQDVNFSKMRLDLVDHAANL